jgi:tol-pal system protein YbgF
VALVVAAALSAGCGLFGGRGGSAPEAKATPDAPPALRQDLERLRGEVTELRAQVDVQRQAASVYADRSAGEVRREIEAVQRALEAAARHDIQRQVEVLDAQARRIDLLERRAVEFGQMLRRVELTVTSLESRLERLLDSTPPSGGAPARSAPPPPGRSPGPPAGKPAGGPEARVPRGVPDAAGEAAAAGHGSSVGPAGVPPPAAPSAAAVVAPPAVTAAKGPPPPAPVEGTPAPARALFDRAMDSWRKGEVGQAVLEFEELVQTYPTDPLAAPAQFWIGEAYFAARDFERSVIEYRKSLELAPKGKEAPRTLLRLGLAYRAQKREAEARKAWSTLVREFPNTDAAEEARQALRAR